MVVVGLIGAGIGMSLSPALHEREAALLGVDYEYRLYDLDEAGPATLPRWERSCARRAPTACAD